jgi:hypothetical protein
MDSEDRSLLWGFAPTLAPLAPTRGQPLDPEKVGPFRSDRFGYRGPGPSLNARPSITSR